MDRRFRAPDAGDMLAHLAEEPSTYRLFYGRHSIKNVVRFVSDHPDVIEGVVEAASCQLHRSLEHCRSKYSRASRLQRRMVRQLQKVHRKLAWAELDRLLDVKSRSWNRECYTSLARALCVLAVLQRYWWHRWPDQAPATPPALERIQRLSRLMVKRWETLLEHLDHLAIQWKHEIMYSRSGQPETVEQLAGQTPKAIYCDRRGVSWLVKYDTESIFNPVLASIFSRLARCPGGDLCPVFLSYDPESARPCSVQPYLNAEAIRRVGRCSTEDYRALIAGHRYRASQLLCQAVQQWLLGNADGNQVIMDLQGNLIFIDQDRCFFYDGQSRPQASDAWGRSLFSSNRPLLPRYDEAAEIEPSLLKAAIQVPGAAKDLAEYVSRVEDVSEPLYEGLLRRASYHANQLCSIFALDISDADVMASVVSIERWIDTLLARKRHLRYSIAERLREVLGSNYRLPDRSG